MTILKKSKAIIAAILIVVTILTGTVMAHAEVKSKSVKMVCGSYTAVGLLTASSNKNGFARTYGENSASFNYLYACAGGLEVDKYNDKVRTVSGTPVAANDKTTTGMSMVFVDSNSTNHFYRVTGIHVAIKGSYEKSGSTILEYDNK